MKKKVARACELAGGACKRKFEATCESVGPPLKRARDGLSNLASSSRDGLSNLASSSRDAFVARLRRGSHPASTGSSSATSGLAGSGGPADENAGSGAGEDVVGEAASGASE